MDPTINYLITKRSTDPDLEFTSIDLNGLDKHKLTPQSEYNQQNISINIVNGTHDTDSAVNSLNDELKLKYAQLLILREQYSDQRFNQAKQAIDPFNELGKSVFSNKDAIVLANLDGLFNFTGTVGAFTKGLVKAEIDNTGGLLFIESDFLAVCTNETPGGFIEYIQYRWPRVSIYTMSKTIKNGGQKLNKVGAKNLYIYNGEDGNGDIETQASNFISRIPGKADLYTANQYNPSDYMLLSEIVTGLGTLKEGGHMIIRMADITNDFVVQLLLIVSLCFKNLYIIRPLSMGALSSDCYLIAESMASDQNISYYYNILLKAWQTNDNVINLINSAGNSNSIVNYTGNSNNNDLIKWLTKTNTELFDNELYYYQMLEKYLNNTTINYPLYDLYKAFIIWAIPDNLFPVKPNNTDLIDRIVNNLPTNIDIEPIIEISSGYTKGGQKIYSNLNTEYQRWLNYKLIWQTFLSLSPDPKIKYFLTNIMVRFLLWWVNYPNDYVIARDQLINELYNKGIDLDPSDFDRLMSLKHKNKANRVNSTQIELSKGDIKYGLFKFNLPSQWIAKMLQIYSDYDHLAQTVMRYSIMQPQSGNFWSIPPLIFDYLQMNGFEYEAYANPMVHNFDKYFSPFPDLDYKYGSLGSFLQYDLERIPGKYVVNPPFSNDFLRLTSNKITQALNSDKLFTFLVMYPMWVDADGYIMLQQSEYLKESEVLSKHYVYNLIEDVYINARFMNVIFLLSNDPDENLDFSNLIKIFFIKDE